MLQEGAACSNYAFSCFVVMHCTAADAGPHEDVVNLRLCCLQATSRLIRSLVGVRKTAPTPSEVVQPAAATRDVYRLLHENIQQLRGSFKHSPLSSEVGVDAARWTVAMLLGIASSKLSTFTCSSCNVHMLSMLERGD